MNPAELFRELKRRRVFRVAVVYAIVAWVLVQVTATVFPHLALPDWTITFIIVLAIVAFPIALILAWAFDLTPEGVRRTEPAPADDPPASAGQAPSPPWRVSRVAFYGGVALLVAGGALFTFLGSGSGSDPMVDADADSAADRSVAVLPFVNMSADIEQEYFSDGITEDLITNLSRIGGLRVISRTSIMRYKGAELPVPEIARELGVGYIVEGSVRRQGNEVRITAQLIDAAQDDHVWADRYDREITGVFQLQSEIADRIAGALAQRLSPADRSRIADRGTADPTAYDLLLRGREYLNRPGAGDVRKYPMAMSFFHQALEVDPGYARAYVGLAEAFRRNVALPLVPVRRDSIAFYAGKAAELDPHSEEAAIELAFGHLFAGDLVRSETEFRRALELDANQADAMVGLARISAMRGRLDHAVRWQRRAVSVDPLSAQRLHYLGGYLFDLGDLEGASAPLERAAALAPDYPEPIYLLALIHLIRGEEDRADELMRGLMAVAADHPGAPFAMMKYLTHRGRTEEAEALIEPSPMAGAPAVLAYRAVIERMRGEEDRAAELFRGPAEMLTSWEAAGLSIPPRGRLYRHYMAGDLDGVLSTLREHWRAGLRWVEDPPDIGVYFIDRDPVFAELRGDPRFETLLTEMRRELDSIRAELRAEERQ